MKKRDGRRKRKREKKKVAVVHSASLFVPKRGSKGEGREKGGEGDPSFYFFARIRKEGREEGKERKERGE